MSEASNVETSRRWLAVLLLAWCVGLVLSGLRPFDRTTWVLEVFPVLIAAPWLFYTRRRFPLTPLLLALLLVHGLILMWGGAYTYARVPLGFWLQDMFSLTRNPYDKIGHFAQGFVPAILARELLIRRFSISRRRVVAFLSVCICLAVSASYELIEWWSALALGQGAEEFLGTQGDPWDTQSDMFCALIGAIAALLLLSSLHDRQLRRMTR
jgi:putative membrane protein